jgi:hypothetical protein
MDILSLPKPFFEQIFAEFFNETNDGETYSFNVYDLDIFPSRNAVQITEQFIDPNHPPTEYSRIFVPNVFPPNRDGQNDRFMPIMNDQVLEIWEYSIYQDTIIEPGALIYSPGTSFTVDFIDQLAWDGLNIDGRPHEGPFEYRIVLSLRDGTSITIDGRACSIACGPDAGIFQSKDGCFFQSQVTDGKLDIKIPNKEDDCFK